MRPIVFHLDMNSYFATVAQQNNLNFRGKPLGVCEHLGGIIIAASIEAKRWGIKTGTPVWEAKKIYPKIILTKTDPVAYEKYIKKVFNIAKDYTHFVELASIDEMYLELANYCNTKIPTNYGYVSSEPLLQALNLATEIKQRIQKEVGDYLTCSIGIASNKLLAKVASDLQKPDGLVVILNDFEVDLKNSLKGQLNVKIFTKSELYTKLALTDIPGIGYRQNKNLNSLGIYSLSDLKSYPLSKLVSKFGINGQHLHNIGQLESNWKSFVAKQEEVKSIGHMYTLPKIYRKPSFFIPVLYKLSEMVGERLRKKNLTTNHIHLSIYGTKNLTFKGSLKILEFICDGREIFLNTLYIFKKKLNLNTQQDFDFKLIGLSVSGLRPFLNQSSLFYSVEKNKKVYQALDKINSKYGKFTIARFPVLLAKEVFQDSVGFGRIKEL